MAQLANAFHTTLRRVGKERIPFYTTQVHYPNARSIPITDCTHQCLMSVNDTTLVYFRFYRGKIRWIRFVVHPMHTTSRIFRSIKAFLSFLNIPPWTDHPTNVATLIRTYLTQLPVICATHRFQRVKKRYQRETRLQRFDQDLCTRIHSPSKM